MSCGGHWAARLAPTGGEPRYGTAVEPFRDVLAAGGHRNSLGRSGELVELLRQDPARIEELFACIGDEDAWVRMRAVDAFEKVVAARPQVGLPFVERVLGDLAQSEQPSVQWHVAQLLAELELTPSQRRRAVAWLQQRIATTEVDWIVASNAMRTLLGFGRAGHVAAAELRPCFQVQVEQGSFAVGVSPMAHPLDRYHRRGPVTVCAQGQWVSSALTDPLAGRRPLQRLVDTDATIRCATGSGSASHAMRCDAERRRLDTTARGRTDPTTPSIGDARWTSRTVAVLRRPRCVSPPRECLQPPRVLARVARPTLHSWWLGQHRTWRCLPHRRSSGLWHGHEDVDGRNLNSVRTPIARGSCLHFQPSRR